MILEYIPILIFLIFSLFFAGLMLSVGFTLGGQNPDFEKNSPYECGFEAFEDSRMKFEQNLTFSHLPSFQRNH